MANQWFRMYADAVDNGKLKLLAFEDRWHFVAIMCCLSQGLSNDTPNFERILAVKLGVQLRELDEIKRRLMEVHLILDDWTPKGWGERQYNSDTSAERTRKYRENKKLQNSVTDVTSQHRHSDVTVTPPDTETDTDVKEKDVSKETSKKKSFSAKDMPELSEQTAADLIAHRKAKGAPMSATVWTKALGEFEKAGLSPEEGAQAWVLSGWQGFKAAWLENEKTQAAARQVPGSTGNHNQRGNYEPPIDPITRRLRELKRASSGNTPVDAIEGDFSIDLAATWDAARSNRGR